VSAPLDYYLKRAEGATATCEGAFTTGAGFPRQQSLAASASNRGCSSGSSGSTLTLGKLRAISSRPTSLLLFKNKKNKKGLNFISSQRFCQPSDSQMDDKVLHLPCIRLQGIL
jgi:hypothetical protein